MLQAQVFTLYPEIFPGPLDKGLYGKAMAKKLWSLNVINIRDSATDKHKTVDDAPYGGGSGMVMRPDVIDKSFDNNLKKDEKIYYLSPRGKLLNQEIAKKISKEKFLNILYINHYYLLFLNSLTDKMISFMLFFLIFILF